MACVSSARGALPQAVMIMCIVFAGWKLTRKLGVMYLTLYILFVTESLLLEYKVIFAD